MSNQEHSPNVSPHEVAAGIGDAEITGRMLSAGVGVLYELEGEVTKEALAKAVFEAMAAASSGVTACPKSKTERQ
jgi:hypothetical protein